MGAPMGLTAMISDMTIGQLTTEAEQRWGEIWDPMATRMTILMLCPRKERKMMELHGDMVEHGQPVVSVFHRPRAEAHLLSEQGFDPREASFQFVSIATADLGIWMQQLITNEGWLRNSVELAPTPFSVGIPSQRAFEASQTLCFRHPSLPALERYYLPFPVESMPGKCFISLPRRAAAEMARQQAEVLGVGRLDKPKPEPTPEPAPVPEPEPPFQPAPVPESEPVSEANDSDIPPASAAEEMTTVPLPPTASEDVQTVPLPDGGSDETEGVEEATAVPLPSSADEDGQFATAPPSTTDPAQSEATSDVELPEPEPETVDMSDLEVEIRAFFQELIDAGVEPSAFMEDPRWEDMAERALAEGLESWPILLEMTAMG